MLRGQRPGGGLWASWVAGDMNVADRQVRLNHLRNIDERQRAVLSNARCLAEGVDVPAIDGVAFVDPRRSQVDIIQAVGRAIRLSPEKNLGTVIIPVVIEPDEDAGAVLAGSEFRHVWDVVNALRAHDATLGDELDELRRRLGRERTTQDLPGRLILDLPIELGRDFASAFKTRLVVQTTSSWEFWFGLLLEYVETRGDARVPKEYEVQGFKLGAWAGYQRNRMAKGTLDAVLAARLEALPGWSWNQLDAQWEEAFARLLAFVDTHGHARVGPSYIEDGYRLGRWVAIQRRRYAGGRFDSDRRARLEALPGWSWTPRDERWEEGYQHSRMSPATGRPTFRPGTRRENTSLAGGRKSNATP